MFVNQAEYWLLKAPDQSLKGSVHSFSCYGSFFVFLGRQLQGLLDLNQIGEGLRFKVGGEGFGSLRNSLGYFDLKAILF